MLGHTVLHASDLFADRTPDAALREYADHNEAIVLTRDKDFADSWILTGQPRKLVFMRSYSQRQMELLDALIDVLPALDKRLSGGDHSLFFEYTTNHEWVYHIPPT